MTTLIKLSTVIRAAKLLAFENVTLAMATDSRAADLKIIVGYRFQRIETLI